MCRGLDDPELATIAQVLKPVTVSAGQSMFAEHEPAHTMYVVVSGQIKVFRQLDGREVLIEYAGRGEHLGEISLLVDGPRTASAVALVETRLLELEQRDFNELVRAIPQLAINLSRGLVRRLHWDVDRARRRRQPTMVALVRTSPRSADLLMPLVEKLAEHGDTFHVFSDRENLGQPQGPYRIESIPVPPTPDPIETLYARVHQLLEHRVRVLIDVTHEGFDGDVQRRIAPCEEIWWIVEAAQPDESLARLKSLLERAPQLGQRIHLIWILEGENRFSPPRPSGLLVARRDYKVTLSDGSAFTARRQQFDVERLVRRLRGTRLGLALGGGGARGLAHFGVMRAFDREGIEFDVVAGTSSGALMGLAYAGGWDPQYAIDRFEEALTPPRFWRWLPGGPRWYLLKMFRTEAWDAMLRPYLHDLTLEQLPLPLCTVAVDLVQGHDIVRDSGDAIRAVMESINIPMVSRPILRDGMALIDGAILNNVPSDVLPERGADLIVGIDVVARIQHQFAGNRPDTPTAQMRGPNILSTFLRIVEVQSHCLTYPRTGNVDLMLSPDTAGFDFADFSKARALADIGDAAAMEILPELRAKLAELDRQ